MPLMPLGIAPEKQVRPDDIKSENIKSIRRAATQELPLMTARTASEYYIQTDAISSV